MMVIGIPKALLFYRYHVLWETFFKELGFEVIISPDTDKEILANGTKYAIDEACLSSKIYLGHVDFLIGKCDYIFIPRISNFGNKDRLCTKFDALYDISRNTFRGRSAEFLGYNVDHVKSGGELAAFLDLGKKLGKRKTHTLYAYMLAKQADRQEHAEALRRQDALLEKEGIKLLIVGHGYNVYDRYIGKPILDYLEHLGVIPIIAEIVDRKNALQRSRELSDTLQWIYSKEYLGSVQEYRDKVDGIILMSAFPCGPDALVNDMLIRRVKNLPILNLLLDGQEGAAGIETRLESFADIIRFKKEAAWTSAG